jgi:UDP-glucose 4-epimerase
MEVQGGLFHGAILSTGAYVKHTDGGVMQSFPSGLKGISLRIANPYGPYQLQGSPIGVIARYIVQSRAGSDLLVWGDGSVIRDYIYINDLADAIFSVVNSSSIRSSAYNIGTGVGFTINDIIGVISSQVESKINVLYQDSRFFDVKSVILDVSKIYYEIGWQPSINIDDGIKMLIAFH